MNDILSKNKTALIIASSIIIMAGIIITYIKYGVEPWETIGGFLCGLGFALLLVFVSLKNLK